VRRIMMDTIVAGQSIPGNVTHGPTPGAAAAFDICGERSAGKTKTAPEGLRRRIG